MRRLAWLGLALALFACEDDFLPEGEGGAGGTTSSSSTTSTSGMGGFDGCSSDADCTYGVQWCESGFCVACDNTGVSCNLSCTQGWTFYQRNGCTPCDCAPPNQCSSDEDCAVTVSGNGKCYAGNLCWDWCPAGDPSCCFGNQCDTAGCPDGLLTGCQKTGCPLGQFCLQDGCAPSSCQCDGTDWQCTNDCGGGVCSAP